MSITPDGNGEGYWYETGGKKYHVGMINDGFKTDFETAAFYDAKAELDTVKDLLTAEEYQQKRSALAEKKLKRGFSILKMGDGNPMNDPELAMLLFARMMGLEKMAFVSLISVRAVRDELMPLLVTAFQESFPGMEFGKKEMPKEGTSTAEDAEKKTP